MTATLTARARSAAGWAYGGLGARIAVQFAGGIVLARLLGPAPFGTVAAAWVLLGAASQLADGGFGAALVQREEIGPRTVRFAFTVQALAGLILLAAVAGAAAPLARLVGHAALGPVLVHLAPILLLQALGQTAASLLRRRLDLRALHLTQLAAAAIGTFAVAIPLAARGWGVESLVAGQLAQSAISTVALYALVRHPLLPCFDAAAAGITRFGLAALAANLCNWALGGLDSLVATRAFGAPAAGLLHRAQLLSLVPGGQLVQGLQSVLFPAYSRHRGDPAAARRVYLGSLGAVALALCPLGAALAATAATSVTGLYGAEWSAAAPLLLPLALAMPLQGLMALSGPLLWARARVGEEFVIQAAAVVLLAAALAAASRRSPAALAWAVAAVSAFRAVAMTGRALRAAGAAPADALRLLTAAFSLAVPVALLAAAVDRALLPLLSPSLRLAAIAAVTAPATLAALWFASGHLPAEIRHVAGAALARPGRSAVQGVVA